MSIFKIVDVNGEFLLIFNPHFLDFLLLFISETSSVDSSFNNLSFIHILLFFCVFYRMVLCLKIHFGNIISRINIFEIFTHPQNIFIPFKKHLELSYFFSNFILIEWTWKPIFGCWIFLLKDLPWCLKYHQLRLKLTLQLSEVLVIIVNLIIITIYLVFSNGLSTLWSCLKRF